MSDTLALVVVALIAAGAVFAVSLPLLRRAPNRDEPSPEQLFRLALLERRDRAYAALKELEFDHRTGKVSDADYRALLAPLRGEARTALRLLQAADRPSCPAGEHRSQPALVVSGPR